MKPRGSAPGAEQVIGTFAGELDFDTYRDDYQVGLREIIDAKIEGREIVAPEVEAPPKVVNLMDALRKSLDTISATAQKAGAGSRRGPAGSPEARPCVTARSNNLDRDRSNLLDNQGFRISGRIRTIGQKP